MALALAPSCGESQQTRAPAEVRQRVEQQAPEPGAGEHQAKLEEDRRVYGELVAGVHAGQAELIHMLGSVPSASVAFRLQRDQARVLEDGLVTADYLDADLAVFHRVAEGADGQPLWLHFDQRNLQLSTARFTRETVPGDAEGAETAHLVWRLFRSLPTADGQRAIWRYTFRLDDDQVVFRDAARLTSDAGSQILPVVDLQREMVYYLDRDREGSHRLMQIPFAGGSSTPVLDDQTFDVRHPRLLPDGRLVVAADPEHDYRLYVLRPDDQRLRPMTIDDRPPLEHMPRYLLAGIAIGGQIEPRVVKVPEQLDLLAVVALVAAHNPAVNRRRALLAASLVDAAGLRPRQRGLEEGATTALESRQLLGDGLRYGLFGLTDEHFDLPADTRLSGDGRMRAEIARDALELELADQQYSAIELVFSCRQHESAIAVLKARRFAARERSLLIETRRAQGHALTADALRMEADIEEIDATLAWRERLLAYATRRLAEICGLPSGAPLKLTADDYRCDQGFAPGPQQLHELAMLNHPRLRGSRLALAEAFAAGTAERLPDGSGGYFATAYGLSHKRYGDPLESYIDRSLSGSEAPPETSQRWNAMLSALRLAETQAVHAVSADVEAALDAYEGARLEFARRRADLASALEELRLARLHADLGPAEPGLTPHPEAHLQAREAYLAALGAIAESRWNVSQAFARVWREASLPSRMVREVESAEATVVARRRPAVFLHDAMAMVEDDQAMAEFIAAARDQDLKRVYLDFGPGADGLEDPLLVGRVDMFLNRCAMAEVEVWAVLGGRDQLPDEFVSPYLTALDRLRRFRERHHSFEPNLAGVQLAFQPAADPRWREDETWRSQAGKLVLARIAQARERFGDLPLWLQVPPALFDGSNTQLLQDLALQVDGVTLLAASDRRERILGWSMRALGLWGKGVEIALELSPEAPGARSLASWSDQQRSDLVEELETLHVDDQRFHGLAWHSYRHWRPAAAGEH